MRNKVCYILLNLLVIFSFVNVVFADEISFTMTASVDNAEVVVGEEVTITVNLKSEYAFAVCQFNVETDDTLELISKSGMDTWNFETYQGTGKTTIHNNSLEDISYNSGKNIFNLKYKVNGDGKVTIKDIECTTTMPVGTDSNGNDTEVIVKHDNISVDLKTKEVSEDTSLSSLKVTGGQLLREFESNIYSYIIELEKVTFSLEMTTSNADYQDDIVITDANGNVLSSQNITFSNDGGQGKMLIYVTVNGDTSHQYELIVNYQQEELDNSLSSLKVNGQEITLVAGQFNYTVKVDSDVTKVTIDAVLKDSTNFQFHEINGPGEWSISGSPYSIPIMIEPKSSQIGASGVTYNIEIVQEGNTTDGNTTTNPATGGISMFVMAFILITSLISSIVLYEKNMESYK